MRKRIGWGTSVLLLGLFYGIVLLINFHRVPATYGYDWPGHFAYLFYLDEYGTPPPAAASAQFFNPPLYYLSVVLFHRITNISLVRAGPAFNLCLALLTFAILAAMCRKAWEYKYCPTLWCIGFYVLNPVIYRAFGMVRPEALLMPLFVAGGYLVMSGSTAKPLTYRFAVLSGLLAGLAFLVRQWGIFLQVAFVLWGLMRVWRDLAAHSASRWPALRFIGIQGLVFVACVGAYLLARGQHVLAFNAPPEPFDPVFLTKLNLPMLFSQPVRPALDYRLWSVLYADFWGDYWRYWREALWHDPLPTSAVTLRALVRAMWAGIPTTVMLGISLVLKTSHLESDAYPRAQLYHFSRILVLVSLVGFVIFASVYAEMGKGDTVKSIYIVYAVPFWGCLIAEFVQRMMQAYPKLKVGFMLPLLLLVIFVSPNCVYTSPPYMLSRTWEVPEVAHVSNITFGDVITLVGYDVILPDDETDTLTVELVWRSDAYTRHSYKVFVHLLDADGQVIAQSDAIPAEWQRPTYAWMLGEFVVDDHQLSIPGLSLSEAAFLRVGLYHTDTGQRLTTAAQEDYVQIDF